MHNPPESDKYKIVLYQSQIPQEDPNQKYKSPKYLTNYIYNIED
jgi:hypothetical protein